MNKLTRRQFNVLTLGSATTYALSTTAQAENSSQADEIFDILNSEADLAWSNAGRGRITNGWNWWEFEQESTPQVSWVQKKYAIDYSHLHEFEISDGTEFEVSDKSLRLLAKRNRFNLGTAENVVIGLRGSVLPNGTHDSHWKGKVELRTATPNHLDFRCVMGIWNRSQKSIRLFTASTVPEVAYMHRQVRKESGANMMPCGLYGYRIGVHRANSKHTRQPGCLLLGGFYNPDGSTIYSKIITLRTLDNLTYDARSSTELWDDCSPGNNIHSSIFEPNQNRKLGFVNQGSKFSSAGCQVIRGAFKFQKRARAFSEVPTHEWASFQKALGIYDEDTQMQSIGNGTSLPYMLLTGDEAALAAKRERRFMKNYHIMRFGSTGPDVISLQKQLSIFSDGKMGVGTTRNLLERYIGDGIPEAPLKVL